MLGNRRACSNGTASGKITCWCDHDERRPANTAGASDGPSPPPLPVGSCAAPAPARTPRGGAERAAINAPIQGSAADVIRRAMIRVPGALTEAGLKARMLLQVHDELVFEAPEKEAEKTIALVKTVMEKASLPALDLSVPLEVEARAAENWDAAH